MITIHSLLSKFLTSSGVNNIRFDVPNPSELPPFCPWLRLIFRVRTVVSPKVSEIYLQVSFSELPKNTMVSQPPIIDSNNLSYFSLICAMFWTTMVQEISYFLIVVNFSENIGTDPIFANSSIRHLICQGNLKSPFCTL